MNSDNIIYAVWEAVEYNDKYLPLNEWLSLEYLPKDHDGIFENEKSWRGFINGNFLCEYNKGYWRDNVKESTIGKYCYPEKEYKDKFAAKIGKDSFVNVAEEDVTLEYKYKLYYNRESNFPCSVEIFVKASIK